MSEIGFVLLVEDRDDDIVLMLRAFKKSQLVHQVAVVRDGEEALDYLFARGAHDARDPKHTPKVILLDLKLPKLSGFEVLRQIRADERTRRVPVVVLSSSIEETDVALSYDLGANSFLRKPTGFDHLVETAHLLSRYWLVLNEACVPAARPSTPTKD